MAVRRWLRYANVDEAITPILRAHQLVVGITRTSA
jgi:hypothetical protein